MHPSTYLMIHITRVASLRVPNAQYILLALPSSSLSSFSLFERDLYSASLERHSLSGRHPTYTHRPANLQRKAYIERLMQSLPVLNAAYEAV